MSSSERAPARQEVSVPAHTKDLLRLKDSQLLEKDLQLRAKDAELRRQASEIEALKQRLSELELSYLNESLKIQPKRIRMIHSLLQSQAEPQEQVSPSLSPSSTPIKMVGSPASVIVARPGAPGSGSFVGANASSFSTPEASPSYVTPWGGRRGMNISPSDLPDLSFAKRFNDSMHLHSDSDEDYLPEEDRSFILHSPPGEC